MKALFVHELAAMAHSEDRRAPAVRELWYWLAVIVVAAIAASAVVALSARARLMDAERDFDSAQSLRLQRIGERADEYFSETVQLANFAAATLGDARGNVGLSERLTAAILRSRYHPDVDGVGAYYAPYAFARRNRLTEIYDHVTRRGISSSEVVSNASGGGGDYTAFAWYRRAAIAGSRPSFVGPGVQAQQYISTVEAFYSGRQLVGVVKVDTLKSEFQTLMASSLVPGDVAWVGSGPNGPTLIATGPIPPGPRVERGLALPGGEFAHLSTDTTPLDALQRNDILMSVTLIAAIACLAALLGIAHVQRWRAQVTRRASLREQQRLENQIALAQTVEAELRKAAHTDSLTDLPNRTAFLERSQAIFAGEKSSSNYAVFFIDLDRFNIVNETLGHLAGDDLLRTIAARLVAVCSEDDLIARLGGDEFVIVAIVNDPLEQVGTKILAYLGEPIVVMGTTVYPEASMGIVAWSDSYRTAEELLRDADIAMYEAKHRGRGRAVVFDAAMRSRVAAESSLESDLRRAIDRGELAPYYQPILSVETGSIVGFEALVRWNHPDGTLVPAHEFLHFAEQRGFITAIDVLMFREVFARAETIFDVFPNVEISVNVSAAELSSPSFCDMIAQMLERHELPGSRIKIEITETAMMTNPESARNTIATLRQLGVAFALDDFGTGYSSLSYLQRLPIAEIKIDRSFVAPILSDAKALEIVRSIVLLAKSFGLATTAEGVETVQQFELLASLGVDRAQGFFFSHAVDIASLTRLPNSSISSRAAVE